MSKDVSLLPRRTDLRDLCGDCGRATPHTELVRWGSRDQCCLRCAAQWQGQQLQEIGEYLKRLDTFLRHRLGA